MAVVWLKIPEVEETPEAGDEEMVEVQDVTEEMLVIEEMLEVAETEQEQTIELELPMSLKVEKQPILVEESMQVEDRHLGQY